MLGRVAVGQIYRTGVAGIRVTEKDGSTRLIGSFINVTFPVLPRKIEGRLYPVTRRGYPGYEAPALEPQDTK